MKKILLIEDEKSIRDIISEILINKHFEVHLAHDGKEGYQRASQIIPDLIISDIMMPGLDGYSILRMLREEEKTRTIPFIFLTSKDNRNDFRKGMELGADDFISKPFSIPEIIRAVEAQIKKHETRVGWLTEELQKKDKVLNQMLRYDGLTGLPNRISIREHFNIWIKRYEQESIAVLSLSLDHYRLVYDVYGQKIADKMVLEVSKRLEEIRESEELVARIQDGDFTILIRGVQGEYEIACRAKEYLDKLKPPCDLDGRQVQITGSIGIVIYPQHGSTYDGIIRKAIAARYNVKSINGKAYQLYHQELDQSAVNKFEIESALRQAISNNDLQVFYQPIAGVPEGKIVGAEALLRLSGYMNGGLSPTKFITVAESSDLIIDVGDYVLRNAIHQLAQIQQNGLPDFSMSINISMRQIKESNLVDKILRILNQEKVKPGHLILELTENELIQDEMNSLAILTELKEQGIKIAIDDFGMGYSSFSHLQRFAFDVLKIDQFFVRHLHESESNKEITRSIIQMAHNLDLKVVAEGVESDEQHLFLQTNRCDKCQGYLISKPLPPTALETFLSKNTNTLIY